MDIEDIIDETETPERSVTLCLKGKLVAEHEQLTAQLDEMRSDPVNLAGDSPAADIADRLVELREEMLAHQRTFLFRAVTPRGTWRALRGKRPVKTDDIDDETLADRYHAWLCEVVAASAVDPAMNPDQVSRLADKLSNAQWSKLSNTAWAASEEDDQGVPFSAAASALSRSSGAKSKRPETNANPAHGSLAGNP